MAIELSGARYRYAGGTTEALAGIDLTVEAGAVVGVAGPNESGKSTLCLLAAGTAPAVIGGHLAGSVSIDGSPTASLRPHEAAQRCGLLFQNPWTQMSGTAGTVFEEVAFGPRNLGLPVAEIVARVSESLRLLGIEDLASRHPGRVSGGQAQLVALASVLALRPAYLVLDEPTSQLDPAGTALVADALVRLAEERSTGILVAEHKTDVLERIADEVVVLDGGAIALRGKPEDVLCDPHLVDLGVEPPARVRIERALAVAGLRVRLPALEPGR